MSDRPEIDDVVFDDDNPEWTEADFARARPVEELPFAAAFPRSAARATDTIMVMVPLPRDVVDTFRATGYGWEARMAAVLRAARP